MISFGNAASSHSGLIPLKTAYKKRGELLWAIASKKNVINLHSAAFVTVFRRNLVRPRLQISHFLKNCHDHHNSSLPRFEAIMTIMTITPGREKHKDK